jgi:hypothetical protein
MDPWRILFNKIRFGFTTPYMNGVLEELRHRLLNTVVLLQISKVWVGGVDEVQAFGAKLEGGESVVRRIFWDVTGHHRSVAAQIHVCVMLVQSHRFRFWPLKNLLFWLISQQFSRSLDFVLLDL